MSSEAAATSRYALNIDQVRRFLPHRAPFLMVDRVLSIEPKGDLSDLKPGPDKEGIRVSAIKCVTYNEPIFNGHFPDFSIFPGVMLIEAMAQTASFSLYPYLERDIDRLARDFQCILVGVDSARFRRPVTPGDRVQFDSVVTKCRSRLWGFSVTASVDGQKVAEADLLTNLILKSEGL